MVKKKKKMLFNKKQKERIETVENDHKSGNYLSLRKMLLNNSLKRSGRKGENHVTDEKQALLFTSTVQVFDMSFDLWTLSLPVVYIVHSIQSPKALATMFWDNAFSSWGRQLFDDPESVAWSQLAQALNMKWTLECGRPFNG